MHLDRTFKTTVVQIISIVGLSPHSSSKLAWDVKTLTTVMYNTLYTVHLTVLESTLLIYFVSPLHYVIEGQLNM